MVGDYLITVEPNKGFGETIQSARLSNKTKDFVEGFKAALEMEYNDHNKYRVICTPIK